jgi:hypothetical protein
MYSKPIMSPSCGNEHLKVIHQLRGKATQTPPLGLLENMKLFHEKGAIAAIK